MIRLPFANVFARREISMNLSNKEVLPSSNPYNVIEEDCGYSFVTETGCK